MFGRKSCSAQWLYNKLIICMLWKWILMFSKASQKNIIIYWINFLRYRLDCPTENKIHFINYATNLDTVGHASFLYLARSPSVMMSCIDENTFLHTEIRYLKVLQYSASMVHLRYRSFFGTTLKVALVLWKILTKHCNKNVRSAYVLVKLLSGTSLDRALQHVTMEMRRKKLPRIDVNCIWNCF